VAALVAEYPIGAGGESMEQAFGAQEVYVGEGGEEEQAFNACGEANEIEQELAALLTGLELVERLNGVHPLHAEVGLLGDGGDVLDGSEGGGSLFGVGYVVVEQREIELHVHRLFKKLA
jgi:hypothetical protein